MVSKVRWRAVLLTGIGLMAGMLPVKLAQAEEKGREVDAAADHVKDRRGEKKKDDDDHGPVVKNKAQGVERYNPFVDGDRVVFTQVTRRAGGSTASIWARDLATGRESLVADVGTGEPLPLTSAGWTAWSDMGPGQPGTSRLRARANAGGPVIDVFTTAYDGQGAGGEADELLSFDLSGDRLTAVNGIQPPGDGRQLVRFTLPSTQPTYVDVMTTAPGPQPFGTEPGVAQSGDRSVVTLGNGTLFSIVDGAGAVVAAPSSDGCFGFQFGPTHPAIDGDRVAVAALCIDPSLGFFAPAIVTCTLPCATTDTVFVGERAFVDFGLAPYVTLRNGVAYWSSGNTFNDSSLFSVDLANNGPVVELRHTSGIIGPRVSVSGNRLVWDESIVRGGVQTSDVYVMDLTTRSVTALRPNGRDVVTTPATGPIRLNPDVRGNQLVYNEVARDGSSAGIWQRSLTGAAGLLSSVATDVSVPRLGTGWTAWNTRDPDRATDRVVATDRPGGALVDVYTTDLVPTFDVFPPGRRPVGVDVSGNRVATLGYTLVPFFGGTVVQPQLYTTALPGGALTALTPVAENSFFGPAFVGVPRTEGRYTAVYDQRNFPAAVRLFDDAGVERAVPVVSDDSGTPCSVFAFDLTATQLVAWQSCFFTAAGYLTSCTLPCANGFEQKRPMLDSNGIGLRVQSLSAFGSTVAMTISGQFAAGRYGSRFGLTTQVVTVSLAGTAAPTTLTNESGTVSEPRVDGPTMVWSVDRLDGGRTGTVTVYDLRRNRSTTF